MRSRTMAIGRSTRQAIGHRQGLCPAAPPLGGGAHPCLAEPQPPLGEGCREDDRERGNLAIYCQRQAHVTPSGCGLIACHSSWLSNEIRAPALQRRFGSDGVI